MGSVSLNCRRETVGPLFIHVELVHVCEFPAKPQTGESEKLPIHVVILAPMASGMYAEAGTGNRDDFLMILNDFWGKNEKHQGKITKMKEIMTITKFTVVGVIQH